MSIPHHHSEWQTLLDISGPFLSLPVLTRVFPQGLDQPDPALRRDLRAAYDEWKTAQQTARPDPRLHRAWIEFVLLDVLGFPEEVLADGAALAVAVPGEGKALCADLAVLAPDGGAPQLPVMVWPAGQNLQRPVTGRGWKASPATRLLELVRGLDVPLGLASNGEQWLLVHAPRGETASFITWLAGLWSEEPLSLRALVSLLGVRRFFSVAVADRLPALFAESSAFQQEVTDQLGAQVRRAVEILIRQLDRTDRDWRGELLRGVDEQRLYQAGLTLMMRLVFLLFAEERGLLLLEHPLYDRHYAISTLRAQLREAADRVGEATLERRFDDYSRLLALFRMVHGGVDH